METHRCARRTWRAVFSAFCCAAAMSAAGRQRIALDTGWKFALEPAGGGFQARDFDDSSWVSLTLPHTWNAVDGADGGGTYVRGDGWYRIRFPTDARWAGRRVYVEFGAANRVAEVWLNGARIGEHRGGYSLFRFELTDRLRPKGDNVLAVRVNNASDGIIPLGGDFTKWGGLVRPAALIVASPAHIALGDFGSSGVYVRTLAVTPDHADVRVRTIVESSGPMPPDARLRVVIRGADGAAVVEGSGPVSSAAGRSVTIDRILRIATPHLWNARADPFLYRASVELWAQGRVIDAVQQSFGLREVTVDPARGLFLNGTHFDVRGVNRHEDWINHGMALSHAQRRTDFELMKEMGVTAVRLCHYEHDPYDYELADEQGLLVWAEAAFVGEAIRDSAFDANAVQQLRELIRQNYNHPSIFCWSVGNETWDRQPGTADAMIARLAAVAREEDPDRFTTYASDHADSDPRNFRTDLLGYNRYFGWYSGTYADFGRWLDAWHTRYPNRPLGISEYGAGASIYQHEQNPPIRSREEATGPWHPEEWQDTYHERAWLALKQRPYLWGTFIWNMFDFASDGRHEGDTLGRNDKGLVTYDRLTRKDAFYWYKANWTRTPLVYITSRRDTVRLDPVTPVKVYSNCDTVELWVNGVALAARRSPDCRFVWPEVRLKPGTNRLFVVGVKGAARVMDSCAWTLAAGTPYRPGGPAPAHGH